MFMCVSSDATHFISFSSDSNTKRNFIAFQSNNNKFVPIDLLESVSTLFSSRSIVWSTLIVHTLATSIFVTYIRFALDGVKYSALCLFFVETNNSTIYAFIVVRMNWYGDAAVETCVWWCYTLTLFTLLRTYRANIYDAFNTKFKFGAFFLLSNNIFMYIMLSILMFIFAPRTRTLYNSDKYKLLLLHTALQRTKSNTTKVDADWLTDWC